MNSVGNCNRDENIKNEMKNLEENISGKEEILNFQGEFTCASFPFVVFLYKYKHDFIPLTLFFSSCLNIF